MIYYEPLLLLYPLYKIKEQRKQQQEIIEKKGIIYMSLYDPKDDKFNTWNNINYLPCEQEWCNTHKQQ